jgi:regulatory protein
MRQRSCPSSRRAPPPPLDPASLRAMALRYVGRYATTGAKLREYLARKVQQRGWHDDGDPPVAAIVDHCVAYGFVDDVAFAESRGRSLARRGFGARHVVADLRAKGIAADTIDAVVPDDEAAAFDAAVRFAQRKRIGPFATVTADLPARRRALAQMLRAGHDMTVARRILNAVSADELSES